jgi:hypothetical protein
MKNQIPSTRLIQYINKKTYNAKKIDIKNTILIVGSPRSGTTWLMEILATLSNYTYTFEPLNPIWCPESFKLGFRSRTYIQPNKNCSIKEDFLKKIFTGQISKVPVKENLIISLLSGFSIKNTMCHLLGKKLIVKSVNMNRMLPWIAEKFPLRKIFLIIRHPCAVISSQIKSGLCGYRTSRYPYIDIFPTKNDILEEASEINGVNPNLYNKLKKIKKREEILAASWCLDNFVPLNYKKPHNWTNIFYEKLVKDGENEITHLFNEIGEQIIPKAAFHKLKKPSMVVEKKDKELIKKPIQQLTKWKKTLSNKQINIILKIVSEFGLEFYSDEIEHNYKII